MGKTKLVWTQASRPFIMGGNTNAPIATAVKPVQEKNVGKGFAAFSFLTPKGTLRIAESSTGAIIGDTFEGVKKDIKEGSKEVMQKQIADAKVMVKKAVKLEPTEFFKLYNY